MTDTTSEKKSVFSLPIKKNSLILAIFAIACTAMVGIVNELTKNKIKEQAQLQLLNTLHSIIEPNRYNNKITQDCIDLNVVSANSAAINENVSQLAYVARIDSKPVAIAITNTAPDGYSGNIDLIIAINIDESISGVRVLSHSETPGLGDKVEFRKSDWITSFTGKKLLSEQDTRWAVTKDGGIFDQFTGATITPRAVVKAIKKTLLYFKKNKSTIFSLPNACSISNEKISNTIKSEAKNEQ